MSRQLKEIAPRPSASTLAPINRNDYVLVKQSRELNKILEVTDKNIDVDYISGKAKMQNKRGDMIVSVDLNELQTLQFDAGTHLFLLYLLYELTKAPHDTGEICVPFKNYMAIRGLKDKKSALDSACRHMAVLRRTSFERLGEHSYGFVNLADSGEVDSKFIKFKPTKTFLDSLNQLNPLPTALGIYSINPHKNPYSVYLLHKLLESKRENGDRIISVKALVDGMNNLPSREDEMLNHRHLTRNIIGPFERDMDALLWCLKWEYCGEKETPAPTDVSTNYDIFINSYIKVYWLDYPDQIQYLAAKAKHQKKATKNSKQTTSQNQ